MNTSDILSLVAVFIGLISGGGWWLSRSQARKVNSEARQVDVSTIAAEAKIQPEVDSIAVTVLQGTVTTLSAENSRIGRRLTEVDGVMERQAAIVKEQAITIGKQSETIADYRQQVSRLTDQVRKLQEALDSVRVQLEALQLAHGE